MKNNKGLYQDIRPHDQPEGTYPYGKNGLQNAIEKVSQNELGHNLDPATLPYPLVGVIEADNNKAVLFLTDDSFSSIGFYSRDTNTYTKILDDTDLSSPLGLSRNHWITGEFQRNFKNEVVVAFTDKNKFPMFLNCDNPNVTSPEELKMFLQASTPTISTSVTNGGLLEKGAYFILLKYLKNDGSETDVVAISKPAIVSSPNVGAVTDKAIAVVLSNLDQHYDQVQIFVVSRIGGAYKAYEGPKLSITPTNINYVYTGEELFATSSLEELIIPGAVYSKVGTIGQLNDSLFIADLEKEPELDLQQYATLVKVRVKSELIDVIPQTAEHVNGDKRSLMHQEVYALYIRYHKTIGGWTKAFHIPGNSPLTADTNAATNTHEADLGAKVFQVNDTNRNINTSNNTCDTGIWVNSTETYPDLPSYDSSALGGRNLRTQAVLHHRMPSLAFTKNNFYPGEALYGKTKLDLLSLEISNVSIPANLVGIIDGYEILIAKRTLGNSLVLGQSLLLLSAQPKTYANTNLNFVSTGGNWHSVTVDGGSSSGPGDFLSDKALQLTGRSLSGFLGLGAQTQIPGARFRFHSFDLLFNTPAVSPSFISPQLKMRVNNINSEQHGYLEDGELSDNRVPIMAILDYTGADSVTPSIVAPDHRTRVVTDTRYVANNANTVEWQNTDLEHVYAGKIKWIGAAGAVSNNEVPIDAAFSTVNKANFQRLLQRPTHEETYLTNLMDIKGDLYASFYSQRLISSATFIPLTTTVGHVYPGEVFFSEYSFHTYGWFDSENHPGNDVANANTDGGYKIVRRFICEAVSNINLRYEVDGNIYSKWWPHDALVPQPTTADGYLYSFDRTQDPNQFGYSRDLNALNEFTNIDAFNPYLEDVTSFPYRIHRGGKLPRQGKIRSWRTFHPLDYYEAQKNMGRIIRVLGMDDHLLIHHENALFKTQDKVKLETDLLSVTLGTGDIFQFEPQEAYSAKQGYAGTQHELAAALTPAGYVFVDAKMGSVFLFRNGLKLINVGLNNFLAANLDQPEKNVFLGNGITVGYDPEYDRILLTVKNMTVSAGIDNFVPNFEETLDFFASLTANISIVYKDGRYQLFKGVNDTLFDCPGTNSDPIATCGSGVIAFVDEDATVGTVVYDTLANLFSDPDSDPLTYTIRSGNTGSAFFLNPTTGILYTNTLLNQDITAVYTLVIRATDPSGAYVECTRIIDVNPVVYPPALYRQEFAVYEDDADTTTVGTIDYTNPESNPVTFTWDPNNPTNPFDLAPTTGEVTKDGTLDFTDIQAYELKYTVTDDVTAEETTGTVIIKVLEGEHELKEILIINDQSCNPTGNTITGITFNGVAVVVTDGVFPLLPGEQMLATIPQGGSHDLVISTTGTDWISLAVDDATDTHQCVCQVNGSSPFTITGFNSEGIRKQLLIVIGCEDCVAP